MNKNEFHIIDEIHYYKQTDKQNTDPSLNE